MIKHLVILLANAKTQLEKQLAYQKLLRYGINKYTADYMVKQYRAEKLENN